MRMKKEKNRKHKYHRGHKEFCCQKKHKNNSQENLTKIQKYEKTKKNVLSK